MQVEYAKSRARALRWSEEVSLVKEEMRRVLEFFKWKMTWWMEKASYLSTRGDSVAIGFVIYANRQASLLERMGQRFRKQWKEECGVTDLPEFGGVSLTKVVPV